MERLFIDKDMATFTRRDLTLVDVTFTDGKTLEKLEPRRLFPISNKNRYIALLDDSGTEQAVIRDLSVLPVEDQKIIESCLLEYYLVPKISCIRDCKERFDGITLFTDTDLCTRSVFAPKSISLHLSPQISPRRSPVITST